MAYLQSITVLVIWAGFATHHARTPLPAALVCRGTRPTALWSAITTGKSWRMFILRMNLAGDRQPSCSARMRLGAATTQSGRKYWSG
jgi:hypothetical protein